MPRLLFEKTGKAVWISHLDLMRLFQRAFKRAGLPLTHTQGFNPRPSVSIALPLSVGIESRCELLDFDLDGESKSNEEILSSLNAALTEGIRVLAVYSDGRKTRDLSMLECELDLEYDAGVPKNGAEKIKELFEREDVPVEKKSKNGTVDQNIIPMIRRVSVEIISPQELRIHGLICCQNPSLNPMQLHGAIIRHLPEFAPDHVRCRRIEIFDEKESIFR